MVKWFKIVEQIRPLKKTILLLLQKLNLGCNITLIFQKSMLRLILVCQNAAFGNIKKLA